MCDPVHHRFCMVFNLNTLIYHCVFVMCAYVSLYVHLLFRMNLEYLGDSLLTMCLYKSVIGLLQPYIDFMYIIQLLYSVVTNQPIVLYQVLDFISYKSYILNRSYLVFKPYI